MDLAIFMPRAEQPIRQKRLFLASNQGKHLSHQGCTSNHRNQARRLLFLFKIFEGICRNTQNQIARSKLNCFVIKEMGKEFVIVWEFFDN